MSLPAASVPAAAVPPTGLPVVNQALEPSWVRHGSPSTQKAYATALAFEQTLVEQLARSLTASSGLAGEEGEGSGEEGDSFGGSSQNSQISSMLPQALSSGVMSGGGLGLAAQLTRGLTGAAGAAPTTTGAAEPGTGSAATTTGATAAPSGSSAQGASALTGAGGSEYTGATS
jgi:Rod binding domain-containing protein